MQTDSEEVTKSVTYVTLHRRDLLNMRIHVAGYGLMMHEGL